MDLHVEVSGTGPALLLIPGGAGDAATFARLAVELARERTVIAYDRRGFSRSPIAAEETHDRYERDVADAAWLIESFAGGRADVFGSSSGAIVGLGLAARHPDKVGRLVAHEPPLTAMVADEQEIRAGFAGVIEALHRSGSEAAMQRFGEVTGLGFRRPPAPQLLPPGVAEVLARIAGNVSFWAEHELLQYTAVAPDLETLRARDVVIAVGEDSGEQFPARAARGLAARLDRTAAAFPGDHDGYVIAPEAFAARLACV